MTIENTSTMLNAFAIANLDLNCKIEDINKITKILSELSQQERQEIINVICKLGNVNNDENSSSKREMEVAKFILTLSKLEKLEIKQLFQLLKTTQSESLPSILNNFPSYSIDIINKATVGAIEAINDVARCFNEYLDVENIKSKEKEAEDEKHWWKRARKRLMSWLY